MTGPCQEYRENQCINDKTCSNSVDAQMKTLVRNEAVVEHEDGEFRKRRRPDISQTEDEEKLLECLSLDNI
jgi:hypothetical protein